MESEVQVQNLDEAVCVLLCAKERYESVGI